MRLIVDTLIALMLVAVLAGVVVHYREQQRELDRRQAVHEAISDLYEQTRYHGGAADEAGNAPGFPSLLLPEWFSPVPVNAMAPAGQPWLDIAPRGDLSDDPPDPVIVNPKQAGFWYNPARGVFRARVTTQFSEQETLALYNQLNHTNLKTLRRDTSADRLPRPPAAIAADDAPKAPGTPHPAVAPAPRRPTLVDVAPRR